MITVGLTGGIGSGKSYLCNIFKEFGVVIYDADAMAKLLMIEDVSVISAIKRCFGDDSYGDDGCLNRSHLSKIIFSDGEKLKMLNSIVHPVVLNDFLSIVERSRDKGVGILMMESAILIESGFYKYMDKVIIVTASEELRISRAVKRDKISKDDVKNRILAQIADCERNKYADFIINNNNNELLLPQIIEILKKIK